MPRTQRLNADQLFGIWAGLTIPWDENDRFDEQIYAKNIERMIAAKVHGIYTTGSTGEFYALDLDEFKRMVDIEADLCGAAGMPLQIGCCADVTRKTITLLEYVARRPEVGAAQVNIPYWMRLTDRELIQFFTDLYRACPQMPLVHYNIPRAKRFLSAVDYLRILEVAPNLIGVKYTFAGSNFGSLQDCLIRTPGLSYFVAETFLVSAMMIGARGCYSSLVASNPELILDMYTQAASSQWGRASQTQVLAARFLAELDELIDDFGEGGIDPVSDKGLAVASGCFLGHQRCRAPYLGWSDQTISKVRAWLKDRFPEFLYPGCSQ